ncbi:tRNA (adenosine(37)-N6)-dimethylallyltransferase MiaA [Robiginitalea sediminis]|uniref:tRNA (adenosine(37)-N6)-dimethylallyltransferase MiaA n=1 Tax=Robiginitalea sediminis TaxID=1982593 RepID=UPI000B4BBE78|nr:tRNA (adenosine(37)-N6)-dimethylallyltransferase MiaA [Robiginitalea sediminis]
MEKTLLSISGPTGIGKTSWAIGLARHFRTEILSSDSRQFYREMRIGTAVPDASELRAAPHHFIGHRSIHQPYSVGDFQYDALALLRTLFSKHDILILVGGSGLYTDAVTQGLDAFPPVAEGVREALMARYEANGLEGLQAELQQRDPDYYREVDLQNPHRVIRALEVCLSSGKPFSSFRGKSTPPDFFRHIPLGVTGPREVIYHRIEARVDAMMEAGLLEEARGLFPYRHLPALQTVGYQELFGYMEGKWDLETAINEIKKNTRRYAKRQLTWLRKSGDILWIEYDAPLEEGISEVEIALK